jgi:hypothetical protein
MHSLNRVWWWYTFDAGTCNFCLIYIKLFLTKTYCDLEPEGQSGGARTGRVKCLMQQIIRTCRYQSFRGKAFVKHSTGTLEGGDLYTVLPKLWKERNLTEDKESYWRVLPSSRRLKTRDHSEIRNEYSDRFIIKEFNVWTVIINCYCNIDVKYI